MVVQFVLMLQRTKRQNYYILVAFVLTNVCLKGLPIFNLMYESRSGGGWKNATSMSTLIFGSGLFFIYMLLMYLCFGATILDLVRAYDSIAKSNLPNYSIMYILLKLLHTEK